MAYYQYTLWGKEGSVYTVKVPPQALTKDWSVCLVDAPLPKRRTRLYGGLIGLLLCIGCSDTFRGEDHIYDGATAQAPTDMRTAELVTSDAQLANAIDRGTQWWTDAVGSDLRRVDECSGGFPCVTVSWADLPAKGNGFVGAMTKGMQITVNGLLRGTHPTIEWMPTDALFPIVAHELGHVMKMGHVEDKGELMDLVYQGETHLCIGQTTLDEYAARYGTPGQIVCRDIP